MDAELVPLMYRAQVEGRCQLQYVPSGDASKWIEEWTQEAINTRPQFSDEAETNTYQVSWRFVTNGGQDEGIIRPVIGSSGWPFYPGSSMKGAFRKACEELEARGDIDEGKTQEYCGNETEVSPGSLRFHGAYPVNKNWAERLLDVIHPQEGWQVKTQETTKKPAGESAYAQLSLYEPELEFGISNRTEKEIIWPEVWKIWEYALTKGIGSRTSNGYGQFKGYKPVPFLVAKLDGEVILPKSLDGLTELRPNIFRAALRGHAQRIFGGLTTEYTANEIIKQLFGGIATEANSSNQAGLLGVDFDLDYKKKRGNSDVHQIVGDLRINLAHDVDQQEALLSLAKRLLQFTMLFSGFGKSWRRIDHRSFYNDRYRRNIGCHWEWGSTSLREFNSIRSLNDIKKFLSQLETTASDWMQLNNFERSENYASWREVWHEQNVCVYASSQTGGVEDSEAIDWLHREFKDHRGKKINIKKTSVTGHLKEKGVRETTIGRIWHRMYPIIKTGFEKEPNYIELLTLFPDNSEAFKDFLKYLNSDTSNFTLVFGTRR